MTGCRSSCTRRGRSLPCALLAAAVLGACAAPAGEGGGEAPLVAATPAASGFSPTTAELVAGGEERLRGAITAERLSLLLKTFTARPRHAGGAGGRLAAEEVHRRFQAAGLDSRIEEYEVLVPWPEEVTVEMIAPFAHRANLVERPTDQDFDTHTNEAIPAHLAFARDGEATAPLVYLNFATEEDFAWLRARGITLEGSVGIARAGVIDRAAKVRRAAAQGLAALLVYSDPEGDGYVRGDPYPKGPWRPESAVARGSVLDVALDPGDPLTPGVPAHPGARRIAADDARAIPAIPAAPLSYGEARPFLEALDGPAVPAGWQGGLPFPYHVGGTARVQARVRVTSSWELRRIANVIGTLPGFPSGEEWIVAGSHRDAWVHGAVSSASGTAALVAAAEALGTLARTGIRPSRSIVFCSFDAEGLGLVGSVEHVEHHRERLLERAVLYVNADVAVSGGRLVARASPELASFVAGAAQAALGDARAASPGESLDALAALPGGAGDHSGFLHHLGLPVVELDARGPCGVRHTLFDTYGWMKRFGDPDSSRHEEAARFLAVLLWRASLATILPHDFRATLAALRRELEALAARHPPLEEGSSPSGFDPAPLLAAVAEAESEARVLHALRLEVLAQDPDPAALAFVNRGLRALGPLLTADLVLEDRPFYRNLLAAPAQDALDRIVPLPGLAAALAADDPAAIARAASQLEDALRRLRAHLIDISDTLRYLSQR